MSLVQRDRALHERLADLARSARVAVVTGLPGTGKSLVIHQLAHLAVDAGRAVSLLQWDVARPPFEGSEAGQRYPVVDGVTQPIIRKAVGLWARARIARWSREPGDAMLLVEAPLVGRRLVELARPAADEAEALLRAATTRFVLPVPSIDVRRHLEAHRERRTAAPRHPREREDAPPQVMRDSWRHVVDAAAALGLIADAAPIPYDPLVYRRVYETVLRDRHRDVLAIDTVLATDAMSVYEFAVPVTDVEPDPIEIDREIRAAEAAHPDQAALARAAARWWEP